MSVDVKSWETLWPTHGRPRRHTWGVGVYNKSRLFDFAWLVNQTCGCEKNGRVNAEAEEQLFGLERSEAPEGNDFTGTFTSHFSGLSLQTCDSLQDELKSFRVVLSSELSSDIIYYITQTWSKY